MKEEEINRKGENEVKKESEITYKEIHTKETPMFILIANNQ